MGSIRKCRKRAILQYVLNKRDDREMKQNLLVLFLPFRNEVQEIHSHIRHSIDELFQLHFDHVNSLREQFECHRELMLNVADCLHDCADETDDLNEEDEEPLIPEETTSEKDVKHFVDEAKKKARSQEHKLKLANLQEINERIRTLNSDQRKIFDDCLEKIWSASSTKKPFHLFISREAGTGKSYLLRLIIDAAQHLIIKSGSDFTRPGVLVVCPTATAAGLIGGQTIQSALKMFQLSKAYDEPTLGFNEEANLSYHLDQLELLIMDEVSMIGSRKLQMMHNRLEQVKGRHVSPFSGVSVICTGDF
jgi:hypothetical protein